MDTEPISQEQEIDRKLESILKPLSNSTRQKILLYLGEGTKTYTQLLMLLSIESGSFYWHIKKMSVLVDQTELKEYKLSELGRKAYELLTHNDGDFPQFHNPLWFDRVNGITSRLLSSPRWILLQQTLIVILLSALLFSYVNLIQIGTIVIPIESSGFFGSLLSILVSIGVIVLLTLVVLYLSGSSQMRGQYKFTSLTELGIALMFFTSLNLLNGLITGLLIFVTNSSQIATSAILIFVISSISLSVTIVSSASLIENELNFGFHKSMVHVLVVYYPVVILSFLIGSGL